MTRLLVAEEAWPIAGRFVIARGAKTEARVVVVTLERSGARGRGEAVPYGRYGESVAGVLDQIESVRRRIEAGCDRHSLQGLLPPGAARNAVDCALWDLEAKLTGERAWARAGYPHLKPRVTAYTLSLGEPEAMAEAARAAASRPLLKLKIGGAGDIARVAAVREAAPRARLIVDANEALDFDALKALDPEFAALRVELIEQPLPVGEDEALEDWVGEVPLCADESLHTRAELDACARRYAAVNIKLDKTGGLTEALALKRDALTLGLEVMAGCMVATSLAMAPAMIVAQEATYVDLDGPLLLARDREPGLVFDGSLIAPPAPALWG